MEKSICKSKAETISDLRFQISDVAYVNRRSEIRDLKCRGFSLVELLVVISIVAVLSVSTVVGFSTLGDALRLREVTGILSDQVRQSELKVLRGDFEKVIIHFLPNYVVMEEHEKFNEDDLMTIVLDPDDPICVDGDGDDTGPQIVLSDSGNLTQKDENEEPLELEAAGAGAQCIDFMESSEIEWNFKLTSGNESSNTLRLIHFNVKRDDSPSILNISEGSFSRVEISAPYGKKRLYLYDDVTDSYTLVNTLDITVQNEDGDSQNTITIRN